MKAIGARQKRGHCGLTASPEGRQIGLLSRLWRSSVSQPLGGGSQRLPSIKVEKPTPLQEFNEEGSALLSTLRPATDSVTQHFLACGDFLSFLFPVFFSVRQGNRVNIKAVTSPGLLSHPAVALMHQDCENGMPHLSDYTPPETRLHYTVYQIHCKFLTNTCGTSSTKRQ